MQSIIIPAEIKVLFNHIYEYKKGIRSMVLCTIKKKYESMAIQRLESQQISYLIQEVGQRSVNLFFGKPECIEAIRILIDKPLNQLTPEEDFILGAILGYDICLQCKRFCSRKTKSMYVDNLEAV